MTRFTGPLKVKMPFSETTVARVDVSGSAQFAQGADFGGNVIIDGTVNVSGATHFSGVVSAASSVKAVGPIRSGPVAKREGTVVLTQQVTLTPSTSVNTTVAVLPTGSDILDIQFFVTTAFQSAAASGNKGVQLIRVGTSGTETAFGTISVSGRGRYNVAQGVFTSAGTSWLALSSANSRIMAQVTAEDGAGASAASGLLSISYLQKT